MPSLTSSMALLAHIVTATVTLPAARVQSTLAFVPPGKPLSSPLSAPLSTRSTFMTSSNNDHYQRHTHTQLYSTIDDSLLKISTIERLELHKQFERWTFFQKLLDGELPASDIEDVLLVALHAYLQHGPTDKSSDNKNENGGNASPVLTEEQRSMMNELIDAMASVSDGIGDSRFLHMLVLPIVDYESTIIDVEATEGDNLVEVDPNALSILQQIEQILPDPIEDEEAFKGSWDVIMDLYGRESVQVKEEALQRENESGRSAVDGSSNTLKCCADSLQWRALCTVGRVLIHYDFLTKGVLNEGTFQ
eukprot:CAMPEP_0201958346 /NCGR_PEP_ID=MMETSP0904-20121228/5536_1 /ASSEMBLY_ACC=CAM_ASM_000553 /TAXON_ID=420261 /ORGANISM="Thalassiosira antarctica, Strain CCMP982" /LENGTH=305 /DNA_ID=CAMNT_0048503673 /DNA_START=53 /DNA_END=970 /DNA_ORIENTATION=+